MLRPGLLIGLLAALIAAEAILATLSYRPVEKLRSVLETGTPGERVEALFILTNRGGDLPGEMTDATALLASPEPLLREWTMTSNFTRLSSPDAQTAYLASRPDDSETRCMRFLLSYRVGTADWMTLDEAREYMDRCLDPPR